MTSRLEELAAENLGETKEAAPHPDDTRAVGHLRRENALLKSALDLLEQGIVLFDERRNVVYASERYRRIYRLSDDQAKPGSSTAALIEHRLALGLKVPSAPDEYVRERLSGPVTQAEAIHEFADGRYIAYASRPLPAGGMAIHEDITDREQLRRRLREQDLFFNHQEKQLRDQNERFDLAINNMNQGLCFFDGEQRLIVCNKRYLEIYDLDPTSVRPGMTLREIIELRASVGSFPDMSPEQYHLWRNNVAVSAEPSDTIVKLTNGRVVKIRHRPMADNGWVATHEDITEQTAAEETLAEQNRRFEAALHNMPHGLSMFDKNEQLIVCNRRYAEMYRLPPSLTTAGASLAAVMDFRVRTGQGPADPSFFVKQKLERSGAPRASTYRLPLMDGRTLQIDYESMPGGGWVTTHQDITEATRAETQINHLARHDALTGLPNRLVFRAELDAALSQSDGGGVAVLYLDLDRFKSVNDTLGHPMGDELLKAVSIRLKDCVRETDIVARLGGDEFAVVQCASDQPQAADALALRLVAVLSETYVIGDHQVVVGTSIGIALAPAHGSSADQLLKNADLALYKAKSQGTGVHLFFEPEMDRSRRERRAFESDLRAALAKEEFELFYQPFINLARQNVVGFEALLRWNHPQRGMIPPADFIPLAEETGLIIPLGAWVLQQACAAAALWPSHMKVAVNLSAVQFRSTTLALNVASVLAATGLAASRLELEITETVMLQDTQATLAALASLQQLGVAISLDDFGTGYSSLGYLRKFPFNKIKVDRSFIRCLPEDEGSLAIVRAITTLGRSLGMTTTAEGVETDQQLDKLRGEACDEVQGYFFSRPVPNAKVAEVIARLDRTLKAA